MESNYKKLMLDAITNVVSARNIYYTGTSNENVKKVCVILSGSRNGSSLIKAVVSKSKDIAYLAGEEEPYYTITGNGFPYFSDSDKFNEVINKQLLLDNILNEMGVNLSNGEIIEYSDLYEQWCNRIFLQFPGLAKDHVNSKYYIGDYLSRAYNSGIENNWSFEEINQVFINSFFDSLEDIGSGYYDIIPENTSFISTLDKLKIEEPPFVIPSNKRNLIDSDYNDKWFIFKTPQDCYRIGLFEKLFPNAEIKYIHLTRGFAQSVNGLMDGWLSDTGFFAYNMDIVNERLNIKGYTDKIIGGDRWWKFDLPENWRDYKDSPLEEVCLNQWHSAHTSIIESNVDRLHIKFEDFLEYPQILLNKISTFLNINEIKVDKLPIIMATNTPSKMRWKKREASILSLSSQSKVKILMNDLGYSMDSKTWI